MRVERIPDLILNLGRDLQVGREVARQLTGGELVTFEEVVQTLKKVEEIKHTSDHIYIYVK